MVWFKFFRVLTGAGRLTPPQSKMWTPDRPDAVPPPNVAHPDSSHFKRTIDGVTPFEKKPCAPCEAKRRAEEAKKGKMV